MQKLLVCALGACLAACVITRPAKGQTFTDQETIVMGKIQADSARLEGYTVQLYDLNHHSMFATSDVHADGQFQFHQAPWGTYLITVNNPRGETLYQTSISISGHPQPLVIRLPKEVRNVPGSGTVSIQQLSHPPSRKAFDALRVAQKLSEAGDAAKAIASIERAIAISPDYADAWVNLAAWHLRQGLYQQSVDETRQAIALGGRSAITLCNLAWGLGALGREAEAKDAVEQALRLKPDDARGHYLLGLILYRTHKNDAEAVRHLQLAAPTLASARTALARIQEKQ